MKRLVELEAVTQEREAEEAVRIAQERAAELVGEGPSIRYRLQFTAGEIEGYRLEIPARHEATITASRRRDFIAGLGEWLRLLLAAADEAEATGKELRLEPMTREFLPKIRERVHYMPGHFGNSFEVSWSGEMERYLEDLVLAGASGYGDWFDPNDMPDPYVTSTHYSTSMFLWNRKKEWLLYSQRLGLDNVIIVTPNIGFVDQLRPEWAGVKDHDNRIQGQVLCPSKPAAREVMLNNQRKLFADLERSGIRIAKMVCAPYDDGGCGCEACQPYYPVFLRLVHDVYDIVRVSYPNVKVDICGWWTSDEESRQLREFVSGPAGSWFGSFQFSATYGVFELPEDVRARIGEMSLGSFVHIAFSRDRRDCYTQTGVHSAIRRIQSIFRSFGQHGCNSFMTYNESFGDHLNAFAAGLLGWDPDRDARDIARFYGRLIYGLRGDSLNELVKVLLDIEGLDDSRAEKWAETLRGLETKVRTHESQEWAFQHLLLKAELMRLDHTIEALVDSNFEAALPLMRERLKLTHRLWRRVYGFGVVRHILSPRWRLPAWHSTYAEFLKESPGLYAGGTMSEEA